MQTAEGQGADRRSEAVPITLTVSVALCGAFVIKKDDFRTEDDIMKTRLTGR